MSIQSTFHCTSFLKDPLSIYYGWYLKALLIFQIHIILLHYIRTLIIIYNNIKMFI